MSTNTTDNQKKVTTRRLAEMKQRGEKIAAYPVRSTPQGSKQFYL